MRAVGERFVIEVLIEVDTSSSSSSSSSNSGPEDIFLVLVAPSFNRACKTGVYSYHPLHWERPIESHEQHQQLQRQLQDQKEERLLLRKAASFRSSDNAPVFAAGIAAAPIPAAADADAAAAAASSAAVPDIYLSPADGTAASRIQQQQQQQQQQQEEERNTTLWLGRVDFGVFTRCGFYDWRICRANEEEGTW